MQVLPADWVGLRSGAGQERCPAPRPRSQSSPAHTARLAPGLWGCPEPRGRLRALQKQCWGDPRPKKKKKKKWVFRARGHQEMKRRFLQIPGGLGEPSQHTCKYLPHLGEAPHLGCASKNSQRPEARSLSRQSRAGPDGKKASPPTVWDLFVSKTPSAPNGYGAK